ncbi:Alpha/Beta hydrolase protein [Trichoderma barbatum]
MHIRILQVLSVCLLGFPQADAAALDQKKYHVRPFNIDLSKNVPHMIEMIKDTHLPNKPVYPGLTSDLGITLDTLKDLKNQWITSFDWQKEQAAMNKFKHYTAKIEGLDIHFIHEKSKRSNSIPLLLVHGWPGSFLEFAPVISKLTQAAKTSDGNPVSFDVIVPSLPGFAFSSPPPANWTNRDTARIFNTLLTEVLGYSKFAVHGTDWGADVAFNLYADYNGTTRAGHFAFLPFFPLLRPDLDARNISTDALEDFELERWSSWLNQGNAYFLEQTNKPNTIGLAVQDNPIGQLAWLAEKFIDWSDPRAGTGPSVLDDHEILRSVSLYYLTGSATSSMFIYAQNPNTFGREYFKANTDAPLLFSAFKYNIASWPRGLVELVGNLVLYRNHDFGGHFPGLDNPHAFIDDLREIGAYWKS